MNKYIFGIFVYALAMLASAPAISATNFLQATGAGGIIILNQTNGDITFCSALYNGGNGQPLGKCGKIGQISATSLSGNASITIVTGTVALIVNSQTGAVVECSMEYNGSTGAPLGSCETLQAL